jgi:hypothetical protein
MTLSTSAKQGVVSKVTPSKEGFGFVAKIDNYKRYNSESKKDANRGRALVIKQMKAQGLKVLCR